MRSKDLFRRGRSPSQSSSHDCDARNRRRRRYASSSAPWHALYLNVVAAASRRHARSFRRHFKFRRRLLREQARASTQSRRRRFPGRSPSRRRDGVTPFPGSEGYENHEHQNAEMFTCQDKQRHT